MKGVHRISAFLNNTVQLCYPILVGDYVNRSVAIIPWEDIYE